MFSLFICCNARVRDRQTDKLTKESERQRSERQTGESQTDRQTRVRQTDKKIKRFKFGHVRIRKWKQEVNEEGIVKQCRKREIWARKKKNEKEK